MRFIFRFKYQELTLSSIVPKAEISFKSLTNTNISDESADREAQQYNFVSIANGIDNSSVNETTDASAIELFDQPVHVQIEKRW